MTTTFQFCMLILGSMAVLTLVGTSIEPAFAQSGSTGGTLGKSNKSVSGKLKKQVSKPSRTKKIVTKSNTIQCKTVASNKGWQRYSFTGRITNVVSVKGSWIPGMGHTAWGPTGKPSTSADIIFTLVKQYNLGALLANIDGLGIINLTGARRLPNGINSIQLRINDGDPVLFDNSGIMTVCFR